MKRVSRKTPTEIGYLREAGLVVAAIHQGLREACVPGVTGHQLDRVVRRVTENAGAHSNFLGYGGFPATVCISVNDEIVHGIPAGTALETGDLVSFDCGAYVERAGQQWHGDAAFSMIVGDPEPSSQVETRGELSAITEGSLWAGIAALADARRIGEVGAAIEDYVEAAQADYGWIPGIIEGYTGHGIGNEMHEDPPVYNYRTRGRTERVRPGMVYAIEPMLVENSIRTRVLDDDWTVVTADGGSAAHWEHTVAVLDGGIAVLTAPDLGAAGLAPFGITPVNW